MLTDRSIFFASALSGLFVTIVMFLLFGIPGLLLGAILGLFGAMFLSEQLRAMLPENRRRVRRMKRYEGLN